MAFCAHLVLDKEDMTQDGLHFYTSPDCLLGIGQACAIVLPDGREYACWIESISGEGGCLCYGLSFEAPAMWRVTDILRTFSSFAPWKPTEEQAI